MSKFVDNLQGGTVGSVVASRLATAGPNLSILVIEGGPNNQIPTIAFPAFFLAHLAPDSKTNDFYRTKETPETANRSLLLPTGSVLGGGSSTNMMMYSRAQRSDWDSWRMPGWSAVEMLPFLRKVPCTPSPGGKNISQLLDITLANGLHNESLRRITVMTPRESTVTMAPSTYLAVPTRRRK